MTRSRLHCHIEARTTWFVAPGPEQGVDWAPGDDDANIAALAGTYSPSRIA